MKKGPAKILYAEARDCDQHGYAADTSPHRICGENTNREHVIGVYKLVRVEVRKYCESSRVVRKAAQRAAKKGGKRK